MRVTANMAQELSVYNIQAARDSLNSLTEKVTSEKMINRPSDDPVNSGTLLDIKGKTTMYTQFAVNITKSKSWLQVTDNALTGVSDLLNAARNLISGSSSLTLDDPIQRQVMNDQLVEIKKQLIEMGNTKYGDQYIFGGGNNLVSPFSQKTTAYLTANNDLVQMTPATDAADLKNGMSVSGIGIDSGTTPPSGTFIANLDTTNGTFTLVDAAGNPVIATAGDGATASTLNFYTGDSTQREVEITTNTRQAFSTSGDRLLLGTGDISLKGVASNPSYGTTNILQTIDELITAVGNTATPGDSAAITAAGKKLELSSKQVNAAITSNSSRILRNDNMKALNDINNTTLTTISNGLQNVDLAALGMQLNSAQTAFQASLASTSKITQMSLLDYM